MITIRGWLTWLHIIGCYRTLLFTHLKEPHGFSWYTFEYKLWVTYILPFTTVHDSIKWYFPRWLILHKYFQFLFMFIFSLTIILSLHEPNERNTNTVTVQYGCHRILDHNNLCSYKIYWMQRFIIRFYESNPHRRVSSKVM